MWKRLPLNIKITGALIAVQTAVLAGSFFWMSAWISRARLKELHSRLEMQADAIEGGLKATNLGISFDITNEMIQELLSDKNFYFAVENDAKEILAEGHGPSREIRQVMNENLQRQKRDEAIYPIFAFGEKWFVQSEVYKPHKNAKRYFIHAAINAQPMLDEIHVFERSMGFAAFAILLLTSLGSGFVVSLTTRNIKNFSSQIKSLRPPLFAGNIALTPQSAEEKLLFDSYKELLQAVQSSAASQRLFLAHASHELKTPIAAALSALDVTLSRKRDASSYEQTCRDVFSELQTLKRLSTALLNLTQLESETISENKTCSVRDILNNVPLRWRKLAEEKAILLDINSDESSQYQVRGSLEDWEIILGNILENAIKYGKQNGYVKVNFTTTNNEADLSISIEDNGIGMNSCELDKLGELFFKADTSRSTSSFGLGFAHAKRILQHLESTIAVKSKPGLGTLVTIHTAKV